MQSGRSSGRAAASLLLTLITLLLFSGCNLGVRPDNASARFEGAPAIHIAAPQPDQTFLAGATVIVQARVENAGPDLARVAVLLDEALLGEQLEPNETGAAVLPLTIDWPTSNAGSFTISVVAERGDGTSARENVNIDVVPKERPVVEQSTAAATAAATEDDQATVPVVDTSIPPTSPPPTATGPEVDLGPSRVAGRIISPTNLRPGPGVAWGQPVGSLQVDDEVIIVAVNPAHDWYRITYGEAGDAWIFAELVEPAEDTAGVPIESGAPREAEDGVNLVVTNIELAPDPPVCGQSTTVRATVRNNGSLDSQTSPWVAAQAWLLSDESLQAQNPETIYLSKLKAGEETVLEILLTITTHYGQSQQIRVTVDAGNHVIETNEDDNSGRSREFTLSQGNCG